MKMTFIMGFLLASATICKAQTEISFGPKAGANFATWSTKGLASMKIHTDFHLGALVNIPVSRAFAIQSEVLYSREGTKFESGTYQISYANVPLLVRYQHPTGFHIETGPQLGILLQASLKDSDVPDSEVKKVLSPTGSSWCLGMGVQLKSGLDFYCRYNAGLSRVGENENKITSNVISTGVAFTFKRKKQ